VLAFLGALMVAFYMWKAYQTLAIKSRLSSVQKEWAKVEPNVTAAQKRSAELNEIIKTTKVLDKMVDERFYWAPVLQTLARCVAPNAQLTAIDGSVSDDRQTVTMVIDGIAAGREPRADAEELRQLLTEQLGRSYRNVKVEFKTLEDLDTIATVAGANMAMARYTISATFPIGSKEAATPAPTRTGKR
jgi:septal ring factor EnvC (AmiA/AmiB activator)